MRAKKPPVRVSDHAVVRYLERVKGYDIDGVRALIAAVCEGPYQLGATAISKAGVTFHFREGCVTTLDTSHSPKASVDRGFQSNGRTHGHKRFKGMGDVARRPRVEDMPLPEALE